MRGRQHEDDIDIDGKIILTYMFKMVCENVTGFNWRRTGSSGGFL
jgi:hypothetical protein